MFCADQLGLFHWGFDGPGDEHDDGTADTAADAGKNALHVQAGTASKLMASGMKERADGINHRPLTPWT